jgi:hypothetical protein
MINHDQVLHVHWCVLQGLGFIADNKEEQSRTLMANVASVNEELEGIVASLHTGTACLKQHMQQACLSTNTHPLLLSCIHIWAQLVHQTGRQQTFTQSCTLDACVVVVLHIKLMWTMHMPCNCQALVQAKL